MTVRFSQEEKELDEKDTLEFLRQGESYSYIADQLGRTHSYISDVVQKLISDNRITEEEIREARNQKIELERKAKKEAQRKPIEARIEKNKANQDKRKSEILQYLKEQKTPIEISKLMGMTESNVLYYKNLLVAEGLIKNDDVANREKDRIKNITEKRQKVIDIIRRGTFTTEQTSKIIGYLNEYLELAKETTISEDETNELLEFASGQPEQKVDKKLAYELTTIELFKHEEIGDLFGITRKDVGRIKSNLKPKEEKNNANKPDVELKPETQKKIINLIKKGYENFYIKKKAKVSTDELNAFIKISIKKGSISQEEIDRAKEEKLEQDKKEIAKLLKARRTYRDIIKIKPEYNSTSIVKFAQMLVEEGLITAEDAKPNDQNTKERLANIDKLVLQGLRLGLSAPQIIDANLDDDTLTLGSIKDSRKRLIDSKKITEDEIKEAQKNITLDVVEEIRNKAIQAKVAKEKADAEKKAEIEMKEEAIQIKKKMTEYGNVRKSAQKKIDSVEAKKEFLECANWFFEHEIDIPKQDLPLLEECLLYEESLLNRDSIQMIFVQYIKYDDLLSAEKFANKGASYFPDTQYHKVFSEIGQFIREKRRRSQLITVDGLPKFNKMPSAPGDD